MTYWGKRVRFADTDRAVVVSGHLMELNSLEFITSEVLSAVIGSELARDMIIRVTADPETLSTIQPCGSCGGSLT